jgi:hypothetical protein
MQSLPGLSRKREPVKQLSGIHIILARFVYDANEIVGFSVRIVDYPIQLARLKRGFEAGIVDAFCNILISQSQRRFLSGSADATSCG